MKIQQIIAASLSILLPVGVAQAQEEKQEAIFDVTQLGQSYRTPMSMVDVFAESRGHEFRDRAYLPPGVPVHAHWKNEKAREFVSGAKYRVLCLVPYYDSGERSREAAAGFFGLALEQNPEVRAYLVDHWPSREMPAEEKEQWLEENLPEFQSMVNAANEAHPDAPNPMRLIPRAAAFMELLKYGDAIPGFSSPACAYNDGGHAGNNANYMFAVMEYCWMYDEAPWDLPIQHTKQERYFGKMQEQILFRLTEQQALALQRIGYHHLASHPMSGFELPEDAAAPPQPADITFEVTPKAVAFSWPEVTDEGTGIYRYIIQRDDGQEFDNVLAIYTDTDVTDGQTYTYQILAEDMAGNRSPASEPVRVEIPKDKQPPQIAEVVADENPATVRVIFDEPITPESAAEPANFAIDGLEVIAARQADPRVAVLTTSNMTEGESYPLSVRNITDTATEPNTLDSTQKAFTFTPPQWQPVNLSDWSGAEMEKEGAQIRLTAKGDGDLMTIGHLEKNPPIVGFAKEVEGDFDFPLAVTSQGKVAANAELAPYQRKHGFVKTGIIIAEDIDDLQAGNHAVYYLSDVPRFHFNVSRNWLVTARVIGAGLRWGEPREYREGFNLPVWMRLVREGQDLTAYYSLTGVGQDDWQELGTISAGRMPENLDLCVFQLSGVDDEHSTAMIDLRASGQEQSYTNVGTKTTE